MPELIERQAALEIAMCYCPEDDGCCSKAGHDIREMLDEIEALPTIEPGVRHGRWIVHTTWHGMFGLVHSECSECKFDRNGDLSSWNFCPNCGRDMRATDTNVGGKGGADNGNG